MDFAFVDTFGHRENCFGAFEFEVEVAGLVDFVEDGGHAGAMLNAVHHVG